MKRALLAIVFAGLGQAAWMQAVQAQSTDHAIKQLRSCLKTEAAARQQCLDQLWSDLTRDNKPASPAREGGTWVISETVSPVDYTPQISAANLSQATGPNAPTSLAVHCRRQRAELAVSTTGSWKASSADEFRVAYRVNEGPVVVEERWAAAPGGRTAVFKGDAVQWLRTLPDSGQITVRVFDWQGPPHEAIFHLDGVSMVREKIGALCKPLPATGRASTGGANAERLRQRQVSHPRQRVIE